MATSASQASPPSLSAQSKGQVPNLLSRVLPCLAAPIASGSSLPLCPLLTTLQASDTVIVPRICQVFFPFSLPHPCPACALLALFFLPPWRSGRPFPGDAPLTTLQNAPAPDLSWCLHSIVPYAACSFSYLLSVSPSRMKVL